MSILQHSQEKLIQMGRRESGGLLVFRWTALQGLLKDDPAVQLLLGEEFLPEYAATGEQVQANLGDREMLEHERRQVGQKKGLTKKGLDSWCLESSAFGQRLRSRGLEVSRQLINSRFQGNRGQILTEAQERVAVLEAMTLEGLEQEQLREHIRKGKAAIAAWLGSGEATEVSKVKLGEKLRTFLNYKGRLYYLNDMVVKAAKEAHATSPELVRQYRFAGRSNPGRPSQASKQGQNGQGGSPPAQIAEGASQRQLQQGPVSVEVRDFKPAESR